MSSSPGAPTAAPTRIMSRPITLQPLMRSASAQPGADVDRDLLPDLGEGRGGGRPAELPVDVHHEPMRENRLDKGDDVVGKDEVAPFEEGRSLGCPVQRNAGARARAELEVRMVAGRADQPDEVRLDLVADRHRARGLAQAVE